MLDDSERAIYDAVFAAMRTEVVNLLHGGGSVLEALLRLRQGACHPALIPGQQAHGSSKIAALLESSRGTAYRDRERAGTAERARDSGR